MQPVADTPLRTVPSLKMQRTCNPTHSPNKEYNVTYIDEMPEPEGAELDHLIEVEIERWQPFFDAKDATEAEAEAETAMLQAELDAWADANAPEDVHLDNESEWEKRNLYGK